MAGMPIGRVFLPEPVVLLNKVLRRIPEGFFRIRAVIQQVSDEYKYIHEEVLISIVFPRKDSIAIAFFDRLFRISAEGRTSWRP